ncbi:hypothetical protein AB4144_00165 [Rhizobiaceae sp. 2RAB30]
MRRYHFEFSGNIEQGAIEADLPDIAAARRDAVEAAREALIDGYVSRSADKSQRHWTVRVYDEERCLVAKVTFSGLECSDSSETGQ